MAHIMTFSSRYTVTASSAISDIISPIVAAEPNRWVPSLVQLRGTRRLISVPIYFDRLNFFISRGSCRWPCRRQC